MSTLGGVLQPGEGDNIQRKKFREQSGKLTNLQEK